MTTKPRTTSSKDNSGIRRGQAIAVGMLAHLERVDKDGNTPADHCAFQFRPDRTKQDNVVLRYLGAVRALDDPKLEAGFCSVLSACLAELAFGCAPDSRELMGQLKLRPAQIARRFKAASMRLGASH